MTADGLRMAIKQLGMSQRGLARALDYNERTIRHYCAGDQAIPRVVEYAVRWLLTGWPSNVASQQSGGSTSGQGKEA